VAENCLITKNFKIEKKVENISSSERLENFRDAKNSLYLKVGNMKDINNMDIKDFNNIFEYSNRIETSRSGKPVPLRESNKRMIQATKEKRKKKKLI